ncbi:MAG: pilus assembly protein PilY [Nitrospirota bacterium]|nr:MAG: pilus assembly protein PilY [Nitrospirota bacterium]
MSTINRLLFIVSLLAVLIIIPVLSSDAAVMEDYCIVPPFVGQTIPPLVMLVMGNDHKLYYEAYNDVFDLNEDGTLDITYNHSIDYYGYFDPYKCYEYDTGGTDMYRPLYETTDKFCTANEWSGNIMNWLSMSRMDVMRKVIYGGYRSADSSAVGPTATVLERAYIPQDAHSWGKEYTGRLCNSGASFTNQCNSDLDCDSGYSCVDRSTELIGMAGPQALTSCRANPVDKFCSMSFLPCRADTDCPILGLEECVFSSMGQLLVTRYRHSSTKTASSITNSGAMYNSFEPSNYFEHYYVTDMLDRSLLPDRDRAGDDYNTLVTTDFEVIWGEDGLWEFVIDGDNSAEIEVDGTIVATYYGDNVACFDARNRNPNNTAICSPAQVGSINLTAGWHRIVIRHFEEGLKDGVRAWYRKPAMGTYEIFGDTLNIRAPDVVPGNECSIKSAQFIQTGEPYDGVVVTGGTTRRHLFCNTTLSDGGTPIMRMLLDRPERVAQWASKERPVCDTSLGAPTDYEVRVAVCVQGLEEANCKPYKTSPPDKPAGLMQKYGLNANEQVCSKDFSPCNNDADCTAPQTCVDRALMYFGLMSGTYEKHFSGGVLRWNIDEVAHDVNNQQVGQIKDKGIIATLNRMKLEDFVYPGGGGGNYYYPNCGWNTTGPPAEGNCVMWGNPTAELMYESVRYFAGRPDPSDPAPTPEFAAGTGNTGTIDQTLGLPNYSDIDNNNTNNDDWIAPYEKFPICSKPFMLVLSDINPSYDSDQLPGVDTNFDIGFVGDLPGFNAETFTDDIGADENIDGNSFFIGESGAITDSICSEKTLADLGSARGICPEEPTKRGSYYAAAVAHYGKTVFDENNNDSTGEPLPDVTTYAVALASPVPKIEIPFGNASVSIVPIGSSVSGCINVYQACASSCTLSYNASTGLDITGCTNSGAPNTGFCATNQIVDFYAETVRNDYGRFSINYEDVGEGADHDMDAIVDYEYCVGSACTPAIAADEVRVSLLSTYAAGCIDQVLGFVISGTTEDGKYLVVRDVDSAATDANTPAVVSGMPTLWQKTFKVSGVPAAALMENPMWYAAKWGGFIDSDAAPSTIQRCSVTTTQSCSIDADCPAAEVCQTVTLSSPGYNKPDKQAEWDEDGDGVPDTYFFVSNPLKLEQQLEAAFLDILRRASSGTAVSVLASGEERGANMLQAVFYPIKAYGELANAVDITWTGRMQNLWFYLDPVLGLSNIREDTTREEPDRARVLDLQGDYITKFIFDTNAGKTRAWRCSDDDGDGDCDTTQSTIDFESMSNLWEIGDLLFVRNPASRTIYTNIGTGGVGSDDTTLDAFTAGLETVTDQRTGKTVWQLLDVPNATLGQRIINYIRGVDYSGYCSSTVVTTCTENSDCPPGETCIPMRNRTATMTVKACSATTDQGCTIDVDCPAGETCQDQLITNTVKLGDIISSTPKIISRLVNNAYYEKYGDKSYKQYYESDSYKKRGMVFTGANDGMFHAIKLGRLNRIRDFSNPSRVEELLGSGLGDEQWAFIPKNSLPYLKYLADDDYCHIYYIDASPYIVDASIHNTTGCAEPQSNTHNCVRETTLTYDGVTGESHVDWDNTSWRTIIIGSMRLGGACKNLGEGTVTADSVETPITDVGYSSYFALDVSENLSDPTIPPKLLWEFSDNDLTATERSTGGLGFSTTGPIVARLGDTDKNGKWYVIITSGPTGPIESTREFYGRSDQPLKIFILDLAGDGSGNANVLDIRNADVDLPGVDLSQAFGTNSLNPVIDIDWYKGKFYNYQDDVIYLGYTASQTIGPNTYWRRGGVLRLLTRDVATDTENLDPNQWRLSEFVKDVGPITSSIAKARDNTGAVERLWTYFGTGRYFYKDDDPYTTQAIYGLLDPCYVLGPTGSYTFDMAGCAPIGPGTGDWPLVNDSTLVPTDPVTAFQDLSSYLGWFIWLDCSWDTPAASCPSVNSPQPYSAERNITHPLALSFGNKSIVYFTTFTPTGDLCGYGGSSYIWGVDHATGGLPDLSLLHGKALLQTSSGEIAEVDLASAFTEKKPTGETLRGRRTAKIGAVPPTGQGLSLIVQPEGKKRVLHLQER